MRAVGHEEPDEKSGLAETLQPWREAAGSNGRPISLSDLAYEARRHGASEKLDGSALSKILSGQRPYNTALLEALARALGRDPSALPHYRLAKAREELDERIQGFDAAWENYERWIAAMRTPRKATEAGRRARSRQETRPIPAEAPNDQEVG